MFCGPDSIDPSCRLWRPNQDLANQRLLLQANLSWLSLPRMHSVLLSTVNVPNRLPSGKRWLVGNVRLLNALVTSHSQCSSTYQPALLPNIVLSSAVTKHQKKAELKGLVSNWRKTVPSQKPRKAPETDLIPTVRCSASRSSISLNNDTSGNNNDTSEDGLARPGTFDEDKDESVLQMACVVKEKVDDSCVGGSVGKVKGRKTSQVHMQFHCFTVTDIWYTLCCSRWVWRSKKCQWPPSITESHNVPEKKHTQMALYHFHPRSTVVILQDGANPSEQLLSIGQEQLKILLVPTQSWEQ